jgi:hypothetical protein
MKDTKLETLFDHDNDDIMHFCGKIHFDMKYCKTKLQWKIKSPKFTIISIYITN